MFGFLACVVKLMLFCILCDMRSVLLSVYYWLRLCLLVYVCVFCLFRVFVDFVACLCMFVLLCDNVDIAVFVIKLVVSAAFVCVILALLTCCFVYVCDCVFCYCDVVRVVFCFRGVNLFRFVCWLRFCFCVWFVLFLFLFCLFCC